MQKLHKYILAHCERGACQCGKCADAPALWTVACLLTKHTATGVVFTQTLSWRRGVTENEAKGEAVSFAMKECPGYAIEIVTATEIPSPNAPHEPPRTNDER